MANPITQIVDKIGTIILFLVIGGWPVALFWYAADVGAISMKTFFYAAPAVMAVWIYWLSRKRPGSKKTRPL